VWVTRFSMWVATLLIFAGWVLIVLSWVFDEPDGNDVAFMLFSFGLLLVGLSQWTKVKREKE